MKMIAYRALAALMALFIIFSPLPALAEDGDSNDWNEIDSILEELVNKAIDGLDPEKMAKDFAKWAAGQIWDQIFPTQSDTEKIMKKLDEIVALENEILAELKNVTVLIECGQLSDIINKQNDYSAYYTLIRETYQSLRIIDTKAAAAPATYNPAEDRLSALTMGVGITEDYYETANTSFDTAMQNIYYLLANTYEVKISGQSMTLDFFGVLEQYMMLNYRWEHQAYPKWQALQGKALASALQALSLEKLSIAARMTRLVQKGKEIPLALTQRAETIRNELDYLRKHFMNRLITTQNKKILPDTVRHYWYNGDSEYFYTALNQQNVPQEDKRAGLDNVGSSYKYLRGIKYHYNGSFNEIQVVPGFWSPVMTYHVNDNSTNLVPLNVLQEIYDGYGGEKSLLDIFFLKSEGEFDMPSGNYTSWIFALPPTGQYALTYIEHVFEGDELDAYGVTVSGTPTRGDTGKASKGVSSSAPSASRWRLATYHNFRVDGHKDSNIIGIGYIGTSLDAVHEQPEVEWKVEKEQEPPKTGDETPVACLILTAIMSSAALLLLAYTGKRRRVK